MRKYNDFGRLKISSIQLTDARITADKIIHAVSVQKCNGPIGLSVPQGKARDVDFSLNGNVPPVNRAMFNKGAGCKVSRSLGAAVKAS
jgi:hypothetical protein